MSNQRKVDLSELLFCEGDLRDSFEKIMKNHNYKTDRNSDGEYTQASVFHMWTGYCLAN